MERHRQVLVIEDDEAIRRFVRSALEEGGYRTCEAETLRRALIEAGTRKPDLIILDLGLPDGGGIEFIRDVRSWSSVPVIVLSARAEEPDKVAALDHGADDYLTKPFGVPELLARVRAAMRRTSRIPDSGTSLARFGNVEVDLPKRQVTKGDTLMHLTPVEFRLLALLLTHAGKVLTHRQLLCEVWGPSHVEQSQYLRVYMAHLRRKLEDDPARPRYLLTETGIGYRFNVFSDSVTRSQASANF